MKRRSTYQRAPRALWWMHPLVLFTLLMSFGSIATAIALRFTGLIP